MSEKEILLTAEKVCKVFTQEKGRKLVACKDISLQLYRGETLGLVGESGCGKSTFVRTIMGLHPATSALDVSVQDSIAKLLARIQKQRGVSYIFICHDLALVSLISHRVMVMQQGSIVEELPGNKLAEAKHPYTKKLLASVFSVRKR